MLFLECKSAVINFCIDFPSNIDIVQYCQPWNICGATKMFVNNSFSMISHNFPPNWWMCYFRDSVIKIKDKYCTDYNVSSLKCSEEDLIPDLPFQVSEGPPYTGQIQVTKLTSIHMDYWMHYIHVYWSHRGKRHTKASPIITGYMLYFLAKYMYMVFMSYIQRWCCLIFTNQRQWVVWDTIHTLHVLAVVQTGLSISNPSFTESSHVLMECDDICCVYTA
jgi:hypothetical protein